MKRSLSLRSETLAELAVADLESVVGGVSGVTCPALDCFSGGICDLTYQPRCFAP